jgi:hypothetical protein
MRRRALWLLALLVVLVALATGAAVALVKPDLDEARARTDRAWTPLRAPLVTRYDALAGVVGPLTAAGAGDRGVTVALRDGLARWHDLAAHGDTRADTSAEAVTANQLEALARRLKANVGASARLHNDAAVAVALAAFDQASVLPPTVADYNLAARKYAKVRAGTIERIVEGAIGDGTRPELVLGAT